MLSTRDFDLCDAVTTAIRTYEIPMYEIEGDDEQALREIFVRMNTFGKALKRAEIFKALHSAPLDVQPSDLDALRERVSTLRFGDFTDQTLVQSVMALRGGKVDRDFRQEFTDDADRQSSFERTEKALRLTVDFLREDAGIPHLRLLSYALYVPVLTRFCDLFGRPENRAAELLRRWGWRGAMVGAAPQGNTVALRRNASAVSGDPLASASRLLELLPPGGDAWQPDLTQVALNRAQAKLNILGLLSAHPVLLKDWTDSDGRRHPMGTRVDQPEILRDLLDKGTSPLMTVLGGAEPRERNLANRLVHPGTGTEGASLLTDVMDERALPSHCVDSVCVDMLLLGRFDEFLQRRADIVTQTIAGHVQRMALWGFADGPEPDAWFEAGANQQGHHHAA
jgi:hypothetical protein